MQKNYIHRFPQNSNRHDLNWSQTAFSVSTMQKTCIIPNPQHSRTTSFESSGDRLQNFGLLTDCNGWNIPWEIWKRKQRNISRFRHLTRQRESARRLNVGDDGWETRPGVAMCSAGDKTRGAARGNQRWGADAPAGGGEVGVGLGPLSIYILAKTFAEKAVAPHQWTILFSHWFLSFLLWTAEELLSVWTWARIWVQGHFLNESVFHSIFVVFAPNSRQNPLSPGFF